MAESFDPKEQKELRQNHGSYIIPPDELRTTLPPIWQGLNWAEKIGAFLGFVFAGLIFLAMFASDSYDHITAASGLICAVTGFGFLGRTLCWQQLCGEKAQPLWFRTLWPIGCYILLGLGVWLFFCSPVPHWFAQSFLGQ